MIPKFIESDKKQLVLFDMDGVCCEFTVGKKKEILANVPGVYGNARPLFSTIEVVKKLSEMQNVDVGILSICYTQSQKTEKLEWLKKFMPFVESDKINIIVLEDEIFEKDQKDFLKVQKIQKMTGYDKIHLVEDNHKIINATNKIIPKTAHHVSEIID